MEKSDEVIIVTGASSGIGKAILYGLAGKGCKLIMACRNPEKSAGVKAAVELPYPTIDIEVMSLNLASFASIRQFAASIIQKNYRINTLINNAGVLPEGYSLTEDGFETAMGVNYLALFLLNNLLLPCMRKGSLILNTTSCSYRIGRVTPELFKTKAPACFFRIRNYASSKRAVLIYSLELAERLRDRGIRVLAIDPGIVSTKMICMKRWYDPLADVLFRPLIKRPEQGADTAVFLTLEAQKPNSAYADLTALYFNNRRSRHLSRKIKDKNQRKWLWESTLEAIQST